MKTPAHTRGGALLALLLLIPGGLTAVTYPDGTAIQYRYDPAGNRSQKTVTAEPTADAYEPDDEPAQATPLISGVPQRHNLIGDGDADQDWVSFSLAAETHLVVRALGTGVDPTSYSTLYLELYNGAGEWQNSAYSYGIPPDARLEYAHCDAPGLPGVGLEQAVVGAVRYPIGVEVGAAVTGN